MKTKEIGDIGEKIAERYLRSKGYKILAKNKHQSHNELDLIVANNQYVVFVEVKTRTTSPDLYSPFGTPASAVDRRKQQRLIQAARDYLSQNNTGDRQPRFDVVEVYLLKGDSHPMHINHIENAFTK